MESTPREVPSAGSIALLFSGGLDTTLEVVERLKTHRQIHLITFDNGVCINTGGGRRRAEELKGKYGADRIVFELVNTSPQMKRLFAEGKAIIEEFRSPLSYDLVCKMSSVTALIAYAIKHGVPEISDGASKDQTQIFLQHPEFSAHIKPWIVGKGLTYQKPVTFGLSREEKLERLKALGLKTGPAALEKLHITSELQHQPFCLRGFVTYFFTSPLRNLSLVEKYALPMNRAKELWDRLLPIAEDYLSEQLAGS